MDKIWTITKKELGSYFDSLIAYILIIMFLGFTGFFTWLFAGNIFVQGQASLATFFTVAFWTIFFFAPAITMRSLAEEKRTGTLELLTTKASSDWQIIVGKFLGAYLLVAICILFTLPYYFSVASFGPIDHGGVLGGYLGLFLMAAAYISIGILASSITNNQIVAFLVALLIGLLFHWIFGLISLSFRGFLGSLFSYLSTITHYDSLSRGVIDLKDLFFFFSIVATALVGAHTIITRRNWQG